EAGPCDVLQLRTIETDGYEAVQLGFLDKKRPADNRPRSRSSQASRSERGHVTDKLNSKRSRERAQAGVEPTPKSEGEPKQFIREIRTNLDDFKILVAEEGDQAEGEEVKKSPKLAAVGDAVTVGDLADLAAVDVSGISLGRGFSGVMKRHNFSGQRASHGVKKVHRHAGGTGMSASPSRLFKGRRMPGQYGNVTTTVRNLRLMQVDEENNLLVVRGAIPGPNGGFVVVNATNKVR
ncbi:MAG: 50S ribosomal protein L3, partial [bacterium]|nr:50S ribosomal protein L3 [bacterium]